MYVSKQGSSNTFAISSDYFDIAYAPDGYHQESGEGGMITIDKN